MRGRYGFDAPVPFFGLIVGALLLAGLAVLSFRADIIAAGVAFVVGALYTAMSAFSYAYTERRGKFAVWSRVLELGGAEQVLDLGCGRGAVLMSAARRLESGRAVGVDHAPGAVHAAARNAALEGVDDLVEVVTGDLRALPFDDRRFDVAVSGLAFKDLATAGDRAEAVGEALRVVRPGGRLLLADVRHALEYENVLRGLGVTDVRRRDLGWRYWYGGPWFATWLVEARRPREDHQAEAPSNEVGDGS
ncbi:class I SAM-dependent methyltransferase [Nonomuraea sp. NPDC050663]|uniref:class I SAM-dependent methyltransferase n=1 Tax=Nonomuraea sp. NPDC050663 TaxID=3364370 RepID=UPI0037B1B362